MKRLTCGGQAMVEFLVVASVVAFALFYPYVGGSSVISILVHALMGVLRARSWVVSVL